MAKQAQTTTKQRNTKTSTKSKTKTVANTKTTSVITPPQEEVVITTAKSNHTGPLHLWLEAWKKMFILRGRTSRFELWSFLWVNSLICIFLETLCYYVTSPHFLRTAHIAGLSLNSIDQIIIYSKVLSYICFILPIFPAGALFIRRMHDLNKLAWHNYLEHVFMGVVLLSISNIAITMLENTNLAYTIILLSIGFIIILYSVSFYSLKFLIMTMFYSGPNTKNKYGDAPQYNTEEYEERALAYSCYYFLFVGTVFLLWMIMSLS